MRPPRAFFPFFFFEGEGVCRVVQEGGEGGPEGGGGWSGTPLLLADRREVPKENFLVLFIIENRKFGWFWTNGQKFF